MKERFRALMDASAKRPGRAALLLVLCAALLGGPLVACQSRAPEESLPDGTYWMVPAKLEWQEPLEGWRCTWGGGRENHGAPGRWT